MVSVTSASRYITSASSYHPRTHVSKKNLDAYPWSDSTEFRGIGLGSSDFYHMGLVAKKPDFGASDKIRFKPTCLATETS